MPTFALDEPGWFDAVFVRAHASPTDERQVLPAALAALVDALDSLVAAGALDGERRLGAEWACWSTVHGFALLARNGPLRRLQRDEVWEHARRAVETIVDGLLR